MNSICLWNLLLLIAIALSQSIGNDVYLSTTGSDSGNCDERNPCKTPERALLSSNQSADSVILHFGEGVYSQSSEFKCIFKNCTLLGGGQGAVLQYDHPMIFSGHVFMEGISFNCFNHNQTSIIKQVNSDLSEGGRSLTIKNMQIINRVAQTLSMGDVYTDIWLESIVIQDSIFSDNIIFSDTTVNQTLYIKDVSIVRSQMGSLVFLSQSETFITAKVYNISMFDSFSVKAVISVGSNYGKIDVSIYDVTMIKNKAYLFYSQNNVEPKSNVVNLYVEGGIVCTNTFVAVLADYADVIFNKTILNPSGFLYGNRIDTVKKQFNDTIDCDDAVSFPSSSDTALIFPESCEKISGGETKKSNRLGLIVGLTVGGVVLIAIIIIIAVVISRKSVNVDMNDLEVETVNSSIARSRSQKTDVKEIPEINVERKLGSGNYGEVFLGDYLGTKVALKKPKKGGATDDFMNEVATLCHISHPNCVQFLGIHKKEREIYIVMEYLSRGDLIDVLRQDRARIKEEDLIEMCEGMAKGLAYLETKQIVHRDVALRNLLVTVKDEVYIVKVSDFGLSKVTDEDDESDAQLAVKWTAPEVIKGGKYTSQSDVWGFGIACWEIFSFGQKPYIHLSNREAAEEIPNGERLEKPEQCPQNFFETVIEPCWELKPQNRPSFAEILRTIGKIKSKYSKFSVMNLTPSHKVEDPTNSVPKLPKLMKEEETYLNQHLGARDRVATAGDKRNSTLIRKSEGSSYENLYEKSPRYKNVGDNSFDIYEIKKKEEPYENSTDVHEMASDDVYQRPPVTKEIEDDSLYQNKDEVEIDSSTSSDGDDGLYQISPALSRKAGDRKGYEDFVDVKKTKEAIDEDAYQNRKLVS